MSRNSPATLGKASCRWARSWLARLTRVATRSLRARTVIRSVTVAGLPGVSGRSRCRSRAQRVGANVGVKLVVFVPGRPVAATQILQLPGRDHEHREPGLDQRVDYRTVRPLDRDLDDPGVVQLPDQRRETAVGVGDGEPSLLATVRRDHAHGVIVTSPVDSTRWRRCRVVGDTHRCLLAVPAVGRHPAVPGDDSRSLTDRRSVTLSPVASRRVLGHRPSQNSCWTSKV